MPVSLDVREFGFEPGSTKDAGAALRDVIEAARRNTGRTRLELPPGDYHVWPETSARRELFVSNTVGTDPRFSTKAIGLLLEDVRDLEVAAQGARLIVHGRQSALAVIDSSRVAIDGLEIDWAVPTVIDVTVMDAGVDAGGAWRLLSVPACTRFRIDGTDVVWMSEESPYTGELYWSGRAALGYSQILDPVSGRVQRAACSLFDDVAHIERVDARTILVSYLSASAPDDRGLVYQLRETDRDHPGMLVLDSADVALQRLRIGYLHGFGLVAQNSADLTLDGVVFRPPEGTGRVTAGFADFVHCSGMRGRVDIRGCEFDGPHDDPINVHGTYLAVATAEANQLELEFRHDQTAGFPQFAPGETIELVHRRTLQPVHTATVEHVTGPTGRDTASASSPMRVGVTGDLPAGRPRRRDGWRARGREHDPDARGRDRRLRLPACAHTRDPRDDPAIRPHRNVPIREHHDAVHPDRRRRRGLVGVRPRDRRRDHREHVPGRLGRHARGRSGHPGRKPRGPRCDRVRGQRRRAHGAPDRRAARPALVRRARQRPLVVGSCCARTCARRRLRRPGCPCGVGGRRLRLAGSDRAARPLRNGVADFLAWQLIASTLSSQARIRGFSPSPTFPTCWRTPDPIETTTRKTDTLRLSWDSPATWWEEAVPLGNGRIGAMVFGGASGRYQLNDATVWSGTPDSHAQGLRDVVAAGAGPARLDEVRAALNAGDVRATEDLVLAFQGRYSQEFLPLADLELRIPCRAARVPRELGAEHHPDRTSRPRSQPTT